MKSNLPSQCSTHRTPSNKGHCKNQIVIYRNRRATHDVIIFFNFLKGEINHSSTANVFLKHFLLQRWKPVPRSPGQWSVSVSDGGAAHGQSFELPGWNVSGSIIDIGVLNNTSPSFKIFSYRAAMLPCCEYYHRSVEIKSQVMRIEKGIKKSRQHRYVSGSMLDIGINNTSPGII